MLGKIPIYEETVIPNDSSEDRLIDETYLTSIVRRISTKHGSPIG